MGGSKQTQTQNSTSQPWQAAQPQLNNILTQLGGINPALTDNQSNALDQTVALAKAGNPYAPAIDSYVTTALGGGPDRTGLLSDAYNNYKTNLAGTAQGDYLDPNKNPFFAQTTNAISNDVQNRVNSMFAGAGRDLSGANQGTLAREITNATAPIYANVYNTERGNQLNAQNALFNAGGSTASGLANLDQLRLGNMGVGMNAAYTANNAAYDPYNRILAAESARQGIPLSTLQQMTGIAAPIGGLGRDTQGTTTTEQSSNPTQALIGAGIAGLGIMSGNPMMGSMFNGFNPMGGSSGNFFPSNPAAAGAQPGFMKGYGYYPMFGA